MAEQFRLFSADELKEAGIRKVAETHADYIAEARGVLMRLSKIKELVSSDDLHRAFPLPPWVHPNAVGAVFASKMFEPVDFVRSTRPSSHGRMIRLYRVVS